MNQGGLDPGISKFLDKSSSDSIETDGEEDLQSVGMDESAPDVLKEAEMNVESFQEQRDRKPKKKQAARAEGGEISSCTRSHSPLLSPWHINTERHSPLSSSVLTHPMFAINSVAEPGLLKLFANRVHSGKEAVVCFSSFIAKAMSDRSKKSSGGEATTPSSKMKVEADRRWAAMVKDATENIAEGKARTEEAKKQREEKD